MERKNDAGVANFCETGEKIGYNRVKWATKNMHARMRNGERKRPLAFYFCIHIGKMTFSHVYEL